MQAKITSIYNEGSLEGTPLIGARGFAVLIETDSQRVLFDTGRRGRYLLHNLMSLDIKPESIDKVVISHRHVNHTGGIEDFLRDREMPLNFYAPKSAMGDKRVFGRKGFIIPRDLSDKADVYEVRDWMEIGNKLFISAPMSEDLGLTESFMVLMSRKGPIVISACSHAGVAEVMEAVKKRFEMYPHAFIGGVHLGRDKEKASKIASVFKEKNCLDLYLNHCTGVSGIMYLRKELSLKGVNDFYVGTVLTMDI
ncbi:MAG: MBL fold metallo-hydrolase [Candidatus Methanoplasma sp.]|jgi:7,8-dihydropterin-6-yl-methyl-4-(beta-D-ribofuranosyl)aminobenzene 5'-phosphate synthase|nr:MBL fold metallo-hydrolase [Candidatus Methanoplasma sp.]